MPALFAARHGAHRATDRMAGARPGAVFCRCAALAGGRCAGARRTAGRQRRRRARCASRCRSCRTSPISTISIRSMPSRRSISFACGRARRFPGDADLIVLPGSKATIADLEALRAAGFDIDIAAHRRRGGMVLGPVRRLSDARTHHRRSRRHRRSAGEQSKASASSTSKPTLSDEKRLEPVSGTTADGASFAGYEMHMGVTEGPDRARPFARLADGSPEGAISADGRVIGTYIHGLFADDRQRAAWLARFAAGAANIAYDDSDRAHARCARRASCRASRSRSPAQIGAMRMRGRARRRARSGSRRRCGKARARGGCRRRVGVAAAVAHRGIVDPHAAIDARAGERKAERAGHRRFRIAGIGRAVARRVAPAPRATRAAADASCSAPPRR